MSCADSEAMDISHSDSEPASVRQRTPTFGLATSRTSSIYKSGNHMAITELSMQPDGNVSMTNSSDWLLHRRAVSSAPVDLTRSDDAFSIITPSVKSMASEDRATTCFMCKKAGRSLEPLVKCATCSRRAHASCHRLKKPNEESYLYFNCYNCQRKRKAKVIADGGHKSHLPTITQSPDPKDSSSIITGLSRNLVTGVTHDKDAQPSETSHKSGSNAFDLPSVEALADIAALTTESGRPIASQSLGIAEKSKQPSSFMPILAPNDRRRLQSLQRSLTTRTMLMDSDDIETLDKIICLAGIECAATPGQSGSQDQKAFWDTYGRGLRPSPEEQRRQLGKMQSRFGDGFKPILQEAIQYQQSEEGLTTERESQLEAMLGELVAVHHAPLRSSKDNLGGHRNREESTEAVAESNYEGFHDNLIPPKYSGFFDRPKMSLEVLLPYRSRKPQNPRKLEMAKNDSGYNPVWRDEDFRANAVETSYQPTLTEEDSNITHYI